MLYQLPPSTMIHSILLFQFVCLTVIAETEDELSVKMKFFERQSRWLKNVVEAPITITRNSCKAHLLPLRSAYGSSRDRSRVGGVGGTVLRDACDRSDAAPRALVGLSDEWTATVDEWNCVCDEDRDVAPFVAAAGMFPPTTDSTRSQAYNDNISLDATSNCQNQ